MMLKKEKLLWAGVAFLVFIGFGNALNLFDGHIIKIIILYGPLSLVLIHSYLTLKIRGLALVLMAGGTGFAAEAVSLHYGTLFGGHYKYGPGATFFNVPLAVIAYWAVFIYLGYWLTNSFRRAKMIGGSLYFLVLLDGLAVTAIDLIMDPVQVKLGAWTWLDNGPYFNIPTGNFIGWFFVTILVTGTFRLLFDTSPSEDQNKGSVFLLPIIAYLLISAYFILQALRHASIFLPLLGLFILGVPSIVCLIRLRKQSPSQ